MKKVITFGLLLLMGTSCNAQWTLSYGECQVYAFGVHGNSLFIGVKPIVGLDAVIYRYVKPQYWVDDDTAGINRSQGGITSFAKLGNYFFASAGFNRAYVSTDNGSHWKNINIVGPVATGIGNGYLYGMLGTSIARSADNGLSATRTLLTMAQPNSIIVYGGCVLAANSSALARSTDSGSSWISVTAPLTNVISFAFVKNLVYATNGVPGTKAGQLMRSTDSGANWTQMPTPSFTVQCLASDGKHLFAGGMDGLFLLDTDGVSWLPKTDSLEHHAVVALGVFDTLLFADISYEGYKLYSRSIPAMFDTQRSGVAVQPLADTFAVYPNPSFGVLNVIGSRGEITLLDLLGRTVLQSKSSVLDIAGLPSGVYYVSDNRHRLRFVKE